MLQRFWTQRYRISREGVGGMVLVAGLMLSVGAGAGLALPEPLPSPPEALPLPTALPLSTALPLPTALPSPEDLPEEVLLREVILQGRSPLDGTALSPEAYAALEAELGEFPAGSVAVSPALQSLLAQLKLLKLLRDIVPFW